MTKQDVFELIKKNPAFHLATVEGNQPRVRGMLIYKADESGIVFHTGKMRDVFKQVIENPNVELCFNDYSSGIQVRVRGVLELIEDNGLKEEISQHPSRVFLKPWKDSLSSQEFYNSFAVFSLKNGVAFDWKMEKNLAPKEFVQL